MAIDTNDEKLALMEWDNVWEPAIPLDEAAGFDQGDKQQLLWGYPGISWGGPPAAPTFGFKLISPLNITQVGDVLG